MRKNKQIGFHTGYCTQFFERILTYSRNATWFLHQQTFDDQTKGTYTLIAHQKLKWKHKNGIIRTFA